MVSAFIGMYQRESSVYNDNYSVEIILPKQKSCGGNHGRKKDEYIGSTADSAAIH